MWHHGFADNKDKVAYYDTDTITAQVNDNSIVTMAIDEVNKIIDRLIMRHNNTFADHMSDYINRLGYRALCITYRDGDSELIVYDVTIINIIQ